MQFEALVAAAFGALQRHADDVLALAALTLPPARFDPAALRARIFVPPAAAAALVADSLDNFFTLSYDLLQRQQNGII